MEELAWVLVPQEQVVLVALTVLPCSPLEEMVVDQQLVLVVPILIQEVAESSSS